MVHGQFIYINVPSVQLFQWHPFTIASSPDNPYLILMIKRAGDWTNKLVELMYECKKKMMKFDEQTSAEYDEADVFNLLHDLHQEIPLRDMRTRNSIYYPKINIGPACATPNDTFIDRNNIVLIGAGSGISPYLPLLEEVIRLEKGKNHNFDFQTARLIFIAREGEQISWISNYLFHVINSSCIFPMLQFYVYITLERDCKKIPSFLFWRAFMLIQSQKEYCKRKTASNLTNEQKFNSKSLVIIYRRGKSR